MSRTLTLGAVILLNACGGAGIVQDTGKNSKSKQTQTSEQPVEVSGGFGLTCVATDHAEDSSLSDFSCRLLDANGRHFQESTNMEAVVQAKIGEQLISVTKSARDGETIFTLTVANDAILQVEITTKFLSPADDLKVLAEKSEPLPKLLRGDPPTFIAEYHPLYPAGAQGTEFIVVIKTEDPKSPKVVRMKDGAEGFKNCNKIKLINATCVTDAAYPSFLGIGSSPLSETFQFNFKIIAVGPGPISVWVDAGTVQNYAGNGNPKSNILTFERNATN